MIWKKNGRGKLTPSQESSVAVHGVVRSFGSGARAVHVLRELDMDVRPGQIVALYGPSGSGKTTLLNLIGLLDRPSAGQIALFGKDITRLGDDARARMRRRQIAFIFQTNTLLPTYTARENIELTLRLPGLGYFERRKRTKAALEAVGLNAWADHMPDELSGGQRQRIAIARALALQPALILADEPTSGLDTRTASRVLTLFRGIAAAQDTTFIIASHDTAIMAFVDMAYDLMEGKLNLRPGITAAGAAAATNHGLAGLPTLDSGIGES